MHFDLVRWSDALHYVKPRILPQVHADSALDSASSQNPPSSLEDPLGTPGPDNN